MWTRWNSVQDRFIETGLGSNDWNRTLNCVLLMKNGCLSSSITFNWQYRTGSISTVRTNPLKRHSWEKNKGFSCSSEWLNPAVECHYQTWLIFLQRWVMSEILSLQETLTSQTLVGQYTRGPRFPTVKGVYSTKRQGNSFQGRDPEK